MPRTGFLYAVFSPSRNSLDFLQKSFHFSVFRDNILILIKENGVFLCYNGSKHQNLAPKNGPGTVCRIRLPIGFFPIGCQDSGDFGSFYKHTLYIRRLFLQKIGLFLHFLWTHRHFFYKISKTSGGPSASGTPPGKECPAAYDARAHSSGDRRPVSAAVP